jgi:hypothetical protein
LRLQVQALLALSGALTGALAGFALGLVPVPDLSVVLALPAAALDAAGVPAPSIRQQVPQYWGRIFPARTVAVLYGARLGVGPLTILPTWLWWAATAIASSRGPWYGAAAGATFAVARVVTMWAAGPRARRLDRADGALRVAAVAIVAAVALAACSSRGDDDDVGGATGDARDETATTIELEPETTTTTTPEDTALQDLLLDDTAVPELTRDRDDVLDLAAAAASEDDESAERALLETRGFVRGVARRWIGLADDVVFVTAYEFGSAEQAELYLVDGTETVLARGAERIDVPDVPGGVGFRTSTSGFTDHAVAFTRGPRWFLIVGSSAQETIDFEDVQRLAAMQAARAE